MRIFAIADPHLSKCHPKPMDIFGGNWQGHPEIFFERWQEVVNENDLVLIPGDISWAMHLEEAMEDLADIAALNGKKLLLRGNHDYWWNSISKVRNALPDDMYALQNDAFRFEAESGAGVVIAGTRAWNCPESFDFDSKDEKIYLREAERLKLSLAEAQKLLQEGDKLIVMLHFPPTNFRLEPSLFTTLIAEHNPDILVYGHVHGFEKNSFELDNNTKENAPKILLDFKSISQTSKTVIHFVAADALAFRPQLLLEL